MKAAYFAVLAMDEAPTRRAVSDMVARILDGQSFDHGFISRVLNIIRPNGDQDQTEPRPEIMLELGISRPTEDRDKTSHARVAKVLSIDTPENLRSQASKKSEKNEPEWPNELRAALNRVRDSQLRELDFECRMLVGRYHAFLFSNCTKSEARNRTRGGHIAAQIAAMAATPQFGDFSVGEYFVAAKRYHDAIGRKPWFRPWDIKAVVDLDDLERRHRSR